LHRAACADVGTSLARPAFSSSSIDVRWLAKFKNQCAARRHMNLDAILYPHQRILFVPVTAVDQSERNGPLSNGTGFPAVTFQAGA
jgi:hypothetical protein